MSESMTIYGVLRKEILKKTLKKDDHILPRL